MAKKVRQPSATGFIEEAQVVETPAPKKKEKKAEAPKVEEPKVEEPAAEEAAPSEPEVSSEDSI